MSGTGTVLRKAWLAVAAGTIGCAIAFGWTRIVPRPVLSAETASEMAALTAERVSLAGATDAERARLLAEREQRAGEAWSAEELEEFAHMIGSGWRWAWEDGDAPARATLVRENPRLEDWSALLSLVGRLEARRGLAVEGVEAQGEGPGRDRRLVRLAVRVRFLRGAVPARDAQRESSLRGPVTSAEAPDSGAGSALAQLDPPGPWAGRNQTQPKEKQTP